MGAKWCPWRVYWLETPAGQRSRARQRGFPSRHEAHTFADQLAEDPAKDAEKIRVAPNTPRKAAP